VKRAGETYSSLDLGTIGQYVRLFLTLEINLKWDHGTHSYVIGLYDRWPRSLSFPT